jgi:hypothetical protein
MGHGRVRRWYVYFPYASIITSLTNSTAVVIGLTPSFAVLVRTGRNAIRGPHQEGQEVQLTTIGGSGGSGDRKKKNHKETWIGMSDSQEELATKQDAVSVATSAHHEEESLGFAR